MKILAHGHYSATVNDAVPPLKQLVKDTTGDAVRRVGRFIQLALIGAGRCAQGRSLPADTAIYLTSGRGDLEVTLDVLVQMIEHGLPPKPLSFINTVSNSACFYIAKQFQLHGRSQCVTRRYAPLESALQLAQLDLAEQAVSTALVGSVDICTEPLNDHRQRLTLDSDTPIGEGSHWFLLAHAHAPETALATIDHVVQLNSRAQLQTWLIEHTRHPRNCTLALGQHVDNATRHWLHTLLPQYAALPQCTAFETDDLPWYDSHCGHTLGAFLQQTDGPSSGIQTLLHIDSDADERFNLLQVSR
ncbi:MAG: hypothetical protein IT470_01230 [Pseudomonadales bacterium]|nr:hypothetical protein [Pseudomonadales bacterium]